MLGTLLKIDACTSTTLRGRYARICVQVLVDTPLRSEVRIRTHKQKIIYEGDGILCMKCGKIDHTISQSGNGQDGTNDKIPTKPNPPKKKMERATETNNGWEIVFNALNGINSPTAKGITPNLSISIGNFPK